MNIITCEQGTPEWHAARCGIPSASNFDKIVTMKGEQSKQREKYLFQLAGESITGKAEETYQNGAMLRGIEMEVEARQLYEMMNSVVVARVGFCTVDDGYGCSPDGMVAKNGLLEIKSPLMATHVGYLLDNKLPSDYFQQVQGQMLVTGCDWCDFMSYYPGMKPLIVRVGRDDKFLALLEKELKQFVKDLKVVIEKIK